ncbi:hypothetical protein JCM5296_001707 [Sporobolomyces johnsonii]
MTATSQITSSYVSQTELKGILAIFQRALSPESAASTSKSPGFGSPDSDDEVVIVSSWSSSTKRRKPDGSSEPTVKSPFSTPAKHHKTSPGTAATAPAEDNIDDSDDEDEAADCVQLACTAWIWSMQLDQQEREEDRPRLPPIRILKSTEHRLLMLSQDNDRWFRDGYRMSQTTFRKVVALLSRDARQLDNPDAKNPILFNLSGTGRPAQSVDVQLATFLRFTSKLTHVSSARDTAVGEGSAYNYRRNIVAALLALQRRFLRLPLTPKEKEEVADGFGLEGCMGAIDGTLFKLRNEPKNTGGAFYCRRKFYGLNLIAAVDSTGCFIAYEGGWPASVVDIAAFSMCALWTERRETLDEGEFWLVDKGFKTTPWTLRPFDDADLRNLDPDDRRHRVEFNAAHAAKRICVEHAFGRLQARFPVLNKLPGDRLDDIWRLICALLVLHNIVQDLKDPTGAMDGWDSDAEDDEDVEEVRSAALSAIFARDDEVDRECQAVRDRLTTAALDFPVPTAAEALARGRQFRLVHMEAVLAS